MPSPISVERWPWCAAIARLMRSKWPFRISSSTFGGRSSRARSSRRGPRRAPSPRAARPPARPRRRSRARRSPRARSARSSGTSARAPGPARPSARADAARGSCARTSARRGPRWRRQRGSPSRRGVTRAGSTTTPSRQTALASAATPISSTSRVAPDQRARARAPGAGSPRGGSGPSRARSGTIALSAASSPGEWRWRSVSPIVSGSTPHSSSRRIASRSDCAQPIVRATTANTRSLLRRGSNGRRARLVERAPQHPPGRQARERFDQEAPRPLALFLRERRPLGAVAAQEATGERREEAQPGQAGDPLHASDGQRRHRRDAVAEGVARPRGRRALRSRRPTSRPRAAARGPRRGARRRARRASRTRAPKPRADRGAPRSGSPRALESGGRRSPAGA